MNVTWPVPVSLVLKIRLRNECSNERDCCDSSEDIMTSPPFIPHPFSSSPNLHSLLAASAAFTTATRLAKGVAALPMPMTKLPHKAILAILKHLEGTVVTERGDTVEK